MKITHTNHTKRELPKEVELKVQRVESSVWEMFKKHHYMSQVMNKGAKCFLFTWDGQPIGFFGILNQTFKGCNKYDHRGSRLVVLPEFQGLGFSKKILDFVGGVVKSLGGTLYTKERHDKLARYQMKSPKWEPTAYNGKYRHNVEDRKSKNRLHRVSYCFKYVGEPIYGYEYLLNPIKELRKNKSSYLHRQED